MSAPPGPPPAVISLRDVTLRRRVVEAEHTDLKSSIFSLLGGSYHAPTRKTVLQGITLGVPRGTKLGIIGPNGSGKTTLLKIIAKILRPTVGEVSVVGRVAPLLELGAGFDPQLSVVQNIVLYGILLGFTRADISSRVERIIEFAELEEFRLYPVRALSTGMTARLGFSIATDVAPDILIVDEVLSVGDEHFRHKSKGRLDQLWREDTTVLTVSHELRYLRSVCDRVIWMDRGRIRYDGLPGDAIAHYTSSIDEAASELVSTIKQRYATTDSR